LVTSSSGLSHIVAIDGSSASSCALVTFALPSRAHGSPQFVTLDLCEWQRVAQDIREAAEALGDCPLAQRLRPREVAS
jgi:hypothetical protein